MGVERGLDEIHDCGLKVDELGEVGFWLGLFKQGVELFKKLLIGFAVLEIRFL